MRTIRVGTAQHITTDHAVLVTATATCLLTSHHVYASSIGRGQLHGFRTSLQRVRNFTRRFKHAKALCKHLIRGRLLRVVRAQRLRRHILRRAFSSQARPTYTNPLLSNSVDGHPGNLFNRLRISTISNRRLAMLLSRHIN